MCRSLSEQLGSAVLDQLTVPRVVFPEGGVWTKLVVVNMEVLFRLTVVEDKELAVSIQGTTPTMKRKLNDGAIGKVE